MKQTVAQRRSQSQRQDRRLFRARLERIVASLRVRPRPGLVRAVLARLARERKDPR